MLISLSRAEKLIGSYNLSLVSFLIERMSKGREKKKRKTFSFYSFSFFNFFFLEKFYYKYWHFHYFNWIFNLLHTVSRGKRAFKDSKHFNGLAVYSLDLQGVRINLPRKNVVHDYFRKSILRQITWSSIFYLFTRNFMSDSSQPTMVYFLRMSGAVGLAPMLYWVCSHFRGMFCFFFFNLDYFRSLVCLI